MGCLWLWDYRKRLAFESANRRGVEGLANSRSLPAGLVSRASFLLSASGQDKQQIASHLGCQRHGWAKWPGDSWIRMCQDCMIFAPGPSAPISDERLAQLFRKTLDTKPNDGLTEYPADCGQRGLSKSTVAPSWQSIWF